VATIESNIEAGCWILAGNIRRLGEEEGISSYFWGSDIRGLGYLEKVRAARAGLEKVRAARAELEEVRAARARGAAPPSFLSLR
jgi:hypothetical protein